MALSNGSRDLVAADNSRNPANTVTRSKPPSPLLLLAAPLKTHALAQ